MRRALFLLTLAALLCFSYAAFGVAKHLKITIKNASSNMCIVATSVNAQQATLKPSETWETVTPTGLALVYKTYDPEKGCTNEGIGGGSVQIELPVENTHAILSVHTVAPGIVVAGRANTKPFVVANRETKNIDIVGDNPVINITISKR